MALHNGDKVKMSESLKKTLAISSADHLKEFGNCIGILGDVVIWPGGAVGPEVDVYWQPSNLRYMYDPRHLIKVNDNGNTKE